MLYDSPIGKKILEDGLLKFSIFVGTPLVPTSIITTAFNYSTNFVLGDNIDLIQEISWENNKTVSIEFFEFYHWFFCVENVFLKWLDVHLKQ